MKKQLRIEYTDVKYITHNKTKEKMHFKLIGVVALLLLVGTLFFSRNVADGPEYRFNQEDDVIEVIK